MSKKSVRSSYATALVAATVGLFAASLLASAVASAKELKLGHFLPPRHTNHTKVMQPWAEAVAKRSNGELTIQIFPSRQLGGTPAGQYNHVRRGVADIAFVVPGYTPTVFPATAIVELPNLTRSAQHATRILWTLFDEYLARDYREVKVVAAWTTDNFIFMSSTPIRRLEDLNGLKIRTPSSVQSLVIKSWGAVPVNMPITKVYTSLERGVIDGMFTAPSAVFSFKLAEVVKSYTFGVGGPTTPLFLLMNKKTWEGLSAEQKRVIDATAGEKLGMVGARAYDARYKKAVDMIGGRKGIEVTRLPAAEQKKFRDAVQPMIKAWIADREKEGIPARRMYEAALAVK